MNRMLKRAGEGSGHDHALGPCIEIERVRTRYCGSDALELLPQLPPAGSVGGGWHAAVEDAPPKREEAISDV
jgi:hypothetical protein